jgi:CheY-like chemotaxis protein
MSNTSKSGTLPGKSPKHLEVLIVQSNPADTLLTVEAFKVAGLTSGLHCVTDGDDALMYVHRTGKYAGVAVPDLIFLDLSQPRMSGLEVLKVIKSTPELMHIPIRGGCGFRRSHIRKGSLCAERQLLHEKTRRNGGVRQVH